MFCTDSLVDVTFSFALGAAQHIPAQNIHVASFCYLVREVLDLYRRIRLTLRPQPGCKFTTNCNSRWLPFAALVTDVSRSPKTVRNRSGSGKSFTMNVESASSTSKGTWSPGSMAATPSTPRASNLWRRPFRCASVATTRTGFPTFRAASIKQARPSRNAASSR